MQIERVFAEREIAQIAPMILLEDAIGQVGVE